MAAATIVVLTTARKEAPETGASVAATAEGFVVANDGKTVIECEAAGAETKLTFTPLTTVDGKAAKTYQVAVALGKIKVFGPFPPSIYNNSEGKIAITTTNTNAKARAYSLGS